MVNTTKKEVMHSPNRTSSSIPDIEVEGLIEAKKRLSEEILPAGAFLCIIQLAKDSM